MLKVAPCTVVRSNSRTTKFFRLDGLLLFCIVTGLRSASSAMNPHGQLNFETSPFQFSLESADSSIKF